MEAGECHLRLKTKATRVLVVSSDVRPGYCYTALTNGRCSNQLPQSITKMQCCCDAGRCWSPGVTVAPEMCPVRSTGKSPSVSSVAYPNTALPGPWWSAVLIQVKRRQTDEIPEHLSVGVEESPRRFCICWRLSSLVVLEPSLLRKPLFSLVLPEGLRCLSWAT